MEKPIPSYLQFSPGNALPYWYRFIAWLLSHFYYARIRLVNEKGQRITALPETGKATLLLASHRNGATDGWVISQLMPHAQFLVAVQLLRARFLRLLFTGIPVVRDKDRARYGFSRAQAGNPVLHAAAHLRAGGSLVIFPEGTSEWGPGPQPYQPGAVKIIRRLLQEGIPVEVRVAGSFYQAPDRFGSHVELMLSEPLALPTGAGATAQAWEAALRHCLDEALARVAVNCPDEGALQRAQATAQARWRQGESYALAFKRAESGTEAGPAEEDGENNRRRANWLDYLLQLPFALTLFPVLIGAWLAGRQADGRNTVAFFRLAGGFAVALPWFLCLMAAGMVYPALWLLYGLAFAGWRWRAVWGEER